jgi:redox-sensitive bicupin YhaK (pirin superfamily)
MTIEMTTRNPDPIADAHAERQAKTDVTRKVAKILRAPAPHWVGDGFRVMGYFSADRELVEKLSPFVLLDYHAPHDYPPTDNPRRGVGPHPHRGFETVTLAFQGSVAHHDSAGNSGVIGPGDVQWMTAASGILHREYHEREFARRGGPMQMVQLWVNLPRQHKMSAPGYQGIVADQIGVVALPDAAGQVRVIAGEYAGVRGPARTFTKINLLDVRLARGGRVEFAFPARDNTALLVMSGQLTLQGDVVASRDELVLFENQGEQIAIHATEDTQLLLLNGEPIAEPVVQYGPFVMNSPREIQQAVDDFNRGAFGHLSD